MPWRGIYSGLPIEFKIDDKDFLEQVYDQEIKFGNGTSITCNLQIETKTTIKDDIEEAKTYYIVKLITQWSDDEHFQYDTKKYKKIKKALKIQGFSYYNITSLQMCPPAKPVWVPPQLHRLPGLPPGQLLRSIARSGRQLGVHLYLVVPQAVQGVPPHWHLLALGMVYPGH